MDKKSFSNVMDHPCSPSPDEWESLRQERDRHPYSATLQVLSLLADKDNGAPMWERQTLPVVSLYVRDAGRLYGQLKEGVPPMSQPEQPAVAPPPVPQPTEKPMPSTEKFDIMQEINEYQEVSFKTAPKSVILSNFLEKDGGITLDSDTYNDVSVQELAKKSILPSDFLETETLAVILEKQGKLAQAIAVYEKLMVNNPEKSSTFAVRIAELKAQLSK